MSLLEKIDVAKIQALAAQAGIDKEKLLAVAQSMLPHLKSKWQSLAGGGDTPLFKDLLADQKFQAMFRTGELDAAADDAAAASGLPAATIKTLLPELGKLVAK